MVKTMAARFQAWFQTTVQAHMAAPRKPPRAPKISCRGPVAICQATSLLGPPVMATLEKMVYSVMATMSSKDAAATTSAGMPEQRQYLRVWTCVAPLGCWSRWVTWECGCLWRKQVVRADVEFEGLEVCGAFGLPGVQRLSKALDVRLHSA